MSAGISRNADEDDRNHPAAEGGRLTGRNTETQDPSYTSGGPGDLHPSRRHTRLPRHRKNVSIESGNEIGSVSTEAE